MRRNRSALNVTSLAVALLLVGAAGGTRTSEDPGDWAYVHREAFMDRYFREASDLRSGARISTLISGDYQCETRLTLSNTEDAFQAEVLVAKGGNVQEQLAKLRSRFQTASEDEIFQRVALSRQRVAGAQDSILHKLWQELSLLRLPVLSKAGLMSPAVQYDVMTFIYSEQRFQFPLPVPNSPNTGYIDLPADSGYEELAAWTRRVLVAIGGEAADAASGGDCAAVAPAEGPAQLR